MTSMGDDFKYMQRLLLGFNCWVKILRKQNPISSGWTNDLDMPISLLSEKLEIDALIDRVANQFAISNKEALEMLEEDALLQPYNYHLERNPELTPQDLSFYTANSCLITLHKHLSDAEDYDLESISQVIILIGCMNTHLEELRVLGLTHL